MWNIIIAIALTSFFAWLGDLTKTQFFIFYFCTLILFHIKDLNDKLDLIKDKLDNSEDEDEYEDD